MGHRANGSLDRPARKEEEEEMINIREYILVRSCIRVNNVAIAVLGKAIWIVT